MTPDNRVVLVINADSSSLKYQLLEPDSGTSLAVGIVEQIGEQSSSAHCLEQSEGDFRRFASAIQPGRV